MIAVIYQGLHMFPLGLLIYIVYTPGWFWTYKMTQIWIFEVRLQLKLNLARSWTRLNTPMKHDGYVRNNTFT